MKHYLKNLEETVREQWTRKALCDYNGDSFTYAQLAINIERFRIFFAATGIGKGDKIAICARNSARWAMTFWGVNVNGCVAVPLLSDFHPDTVSNLTNHSDSVLLFVDDDIWAKQNPADMPNLKAAINVKDGNLLWHQDQAVADAWENRKSAFTQQHPNGMFPEQVSYSTDNGDDVAIINYTSGTTGNPKGVMLTHRNFLTNVEGILPIIPTPNDYNRVLSYLPLCHVYERMMNYSWQYLGIPVYYAESLAKIADNMQEVNPTIFTTVPRLLEKIYDKILSKGRKLTGIKHKIFFWANDIALDFDFNKKKSYYRRLNRARKLVLNQWKAVTGTSLRVIVTGGAAIQPRISRVFWALGVPVLEGYGTSETSPVIAVSNFFKNGLEFGTAGPVLPGTQLKIAEDGEILARGKHVMKGYYKADDLTAEAIDKDGWLHTGDLGKLSPEGRLSITGRKKEMFKTAFGKYVVPTIIENKFAEESLIDNIMVVGENKQFAAALIVPNFPDLRSWCVNKGIEYTTNEEMIKHPEVLAKYKKIVDHFNQFFGDTEKVKRYILIGYEWSVATGELTPTLKLKRNMLMKKYEKQIEQLFS